MAKTDQWYVLATIAKNPTHAYPFAVVAIDPEEQPRQEITCRSRRDCLIAGNAIAAGLMFAGEKCNPNTVFDERAFGTEKEIV